MLRPYWTFRHGGSKGRGTKIGNNSASATNHWPGKTLAVHFSRKQRGRADYIGEGVTPINLHENRNNNRSYRIV